MKQNAYYTVEATFIVTISILLVMAVLYTGLYVHDRIVVETVTEQRTAIWEHQAEEKKDSESEFKNKLEEDLRNKLFLVSVSGINVEDGLASITVDVGYTLPVSLSFLKRIWADDSGMRTEAVKAARVWPAKWKWDADVIRNG